MGRFLGSALAALSVVTLVSVGWVTPLWGRPAGATPTVALTAASTTAVVQRYPGEPVWWDLGAYVSAVGGAFELHVSRHGRGWTVEQVARGDDGTTRVVRRLPRGTVTDIGAGLVGFFELTVRDPGGNVVHRSLMPFCPGGDYNLARTGDDGPDTRTYSDWCAGSDLTRATVWGIDRDWAVPAASPWDDQGLDLADGTYEVTLRITDRYLRALEIDPTRSSVDVRVEVVTVDPGWGCEPPDEECEAVVASGGGDRRARGRDAGQGQARNAADRVVPAVVADADGLPDLISLPAFAVSLSVDDAGRQWLEFAANVWNGGDGPLVVEGFRQPGQDLMDAFQYFYTDGRKTGRAVVGTLEFDRRDGHHHWHFTDFARYRLTDAGGTRGVRSEKEAFCLAPTDAIDLTLAGANWRPGSTGLHTACGWDNSIWIREILDVGWGDTYYQSLPGQSFDVTDLPDGIYYLEVTANPDGRLRELTTDNNTSRRKVELRTSRGVRTARTP
ncbi:MAG TPA: lysyl oxidase family protein [Nitriliruptorales bacterium]|nr:lysyl oxidase family protein [Nitriliruptorales bacterium]